MEVILRLLRRWLEDADAKSSLDRPSAGLDIHQTEVAHEACVRVGSAGLADAEKMLLAVEITFSALCMR